MPVSYTAAPPIPVSFSCRSDARLRLSDGRGCDGKIGADTDRALVLAEAEEVRVRREMASRRHGWKWLDGMYRLNNPGRSKEC